MAEGLTISLLVTLIGMGLVFAAIVLFWVMMSALMRLMDRRAGATSVQVDAGEEQVAASDERSLRRRAAVAAVAVAVAQRGADDQPQPFPLPPAVVVTTWQAVMRSRLHGQRGGIR